MIRPLIAIIFLAAVGTGAAQDIDASRAKEQRPCDLVLFDKEVRSALRANDVASIALLVEYPLRVNDANGSFYIHDPASLHGHFEGIFTASVRGAVLDEHSESDSCGAHTVIYGDGQAVATLYDRGYRITSINVSASSVEAKSIVGRVEFACRTKASRMVLDRTAGGRLRLRGWAKGRSLNEKPDIEIVGGDKEIEGKGPCTHSVWTFQSRATRFSFSDGGCYPDSNEPPTGSIGQFSEYRGGDEESAWCF